LNQKSNRNRIYENAFKLQQWLERWIRLEGRLPKDFADLEKITQEAPVNPITGKPMKVLFVASHQGAGLGDAIFDFSVDFGGERYVLKVLGLDGEKIVLYPSFSQWKKKARA
jgi:hypothetical protein